MKFISSITIFILLLSSCANIVAPTGGDKDVNTPKLLSTLDAESMKHVHTKIITFEFDEFIVLNNWEENFYISPPIAKRIQKDIKGKILTLTLEDTLALNTTYFIDLNNCIKDLNEGNVLDTLDYIFSTSDELDTLTISGKLQDAYTLESIENAWVMLFEESKNDTIIFKENPDYIAKTNKEGYFNFQNLNSKNYKIVALTDFDFIYNTEEKIAFNDTIINAETDSFISLLAFDPFVKIDSTIVDTLITNTDSTATDSLLVEEKTFGNLTIITAINNSCIFQLLQNNKIIKEFVFVEQPFLLADITPGKYQLKYIADSNTDSEWTTGNWKAKIQPEKVINYSSEITIRANWDLELEWFIEE